MTLNFILLYRPVFFFFHFNILMLLHLYFINTLIGFCMLQLFHFVIKNIGFLFILLFFQIAFEIPPEEHDCIYDNEG